MIWGFFSDRFGPTSPHQIIDFFKNDPTYGVTLVGGGEWWWRTDTAQGWSDVFKRFDVYSPWNVGNVSIDGTNKFASTAYWTDDLAMASSLGVLYLPVIYPGFSWDNLQRQPPGTSLIPRLGATFSGSNSTPLKTWDSTWPTWPCSTKWTKGLPFSKVSNTAADAGVFCLLRWPAGRLVFASGCRRLKNS